MINPIRKRFYRLFVASRQQRQDLRNREIVCNVVLLGTGFVVAAMFLILLISFTVEHNQYALSRLIICGTAFFYLGTIHTFIRKGWYYLSAYLLVLFYALLAFSIVWTWSINIPFGILLFGLVIVLSGVLLSARHALYAALVSVSIVAAAYTFEVTGWHTPDTSWIPTGSTLADVETYAIGFSILALVSWLYGREMERSLERAQAAEVALLKEKTMLEVRVKKRTMELQSAQLEEMRQMYRFAELGQLSTALLHDLANYLTVLTLEIQGMQSKKHAEAIARSQNIIQYLDDMVDSVREQLNGAVQVQTFNIIKKTTEAIEMLRYKSREAGVTLDWLPPTGPVYFTGDPTRLSQVVAIVVSNAIDAYRGQTKAQVDDKTVKIRMEQEGNKILIRVADRGKGISLQKREHLFKPFHTTKHSGMGIGLFIAKQTIETHFAGTISFTSRAGHTEFIITVVSPA